MVRRTPLVLALLTPLIFACADDGGAGFNDFCEAQADWPSEWIAAENQVLMIVNQHRSQGAVCGAQTFGPTGPLSADPQLRCAARLHSADMAMRGFFAHDNPDGESFVDRVGKTEYAGSPAGENIALGYSSPEAVMDGWMDSPGHCANIMNPNYDHLGVGYYEGNYWTQVMGRE
jgi:uncharacterized protein YkwD